MLKYFYSMKTALLLMTLIIILSIIGTLQADGAIYDSYFYQCLILLLIINTLFCTGKRLPQLLKKTGIQKVSFQQARKDFPKDTEINIPDPDITIDKINAFYRKQGYRVNPLHNEEEKLIGARKGMISVIASQVIHWALIVVFCGAFIGSFGAVAEVSGAVGQIADLPESITKPQLHIRIDDFTTLYNTDRSVENWVTRLTLLVEEKELANGTSKVNHPFQYHGLSIYQSGYGYQCNVELNQNGITKKYHFPINQIMSDGKKAFMLEKKGPGQFTLKVYENNRESRNYQLNQGTVVNLSNQTSMTLLSETAYTVLKVKTDPGNAGVMIGLIIGSIGFMLLYTGQYREIKVLIHRLNKTAQISVHCKNQLLCEQLTNEVLTIIGNLNSGEESENSELKLKR